MLIGGFVKSFACRDIGMDCDFKATAQDENALMKQIAEHARTAHNMKKIDKATMAKIKAAIKEM
jgi:predicted small metal-binding protein